MERKSFVSRYAHIPLTAVVGVVIAVVMMLLFDAFFYFVPDAKKDMSWAYMVCVFIVFWYVKDIRRDVKKIREMMEKKG